MPEVNISSAIASDLTTTVIDYSVATQSTDGATGQKEYEWINTHWTQDLGYYKTIPELNSVIDAREIWTIGKGYKSEELTQLTLMSIKGIGNDTFNTVLGNMIRTMWLTGDAFCEIIRDDNRLTNLKTIDPSTIKIISNSQGRIIRYEQISKIKNPTKKIQPDKIFHLSRNRIADEIHGTGIAEKLATIILMRNEAMSDYKQVMHWFVKPRWIFHLDTDDTTEINAFKAKQDAANAAGENMYIPKGAVVPELMAVAPNATMNPMAWIEVLNDYFYEAAQTPKFIVGASKGFTEAAEKISYLAFQQSVEKDQLYVEEQVLSQLNLEIELEFPVSLENELISDKQKDGPENIVPSDTTAGAGA